MDFITIDVETANPNLASICQVGVALFAHGQFLESWSSLVNPRDYFSPHHIAVHGIDEARVSSAPSWAAVHDRLRVAACDHILASHTPFDRVAIARACAQAKTPPFACRWLDTARVVRRTWPAFARSGYGLANVAANLGITFTHHDAEEDARAAGEILLHAIRESGSSASDWCALSMHAPPSLQHLGSLVANPDGPLFGDVVVFTGALSMPRHEASQMAARLGCEVAPGVTRHTTMLVVGDQDIQRLMGRDKSSKHRKAEELMAKGQPIRIVGESDFQHLIQSKNTS